MATDTYSEYVILIDFFTATMVEQTRLNVTSYVQSDQTVSVHLMITIQKVTSNVQSFPRQSPDIY
jgi:hypothetical protein